MAKKMEREVICPITGVKHLIVHNNDEENIRALRKWATTLYIRMERKHKVILSIDCEGWKLGTVKNSLGLLQICEILDESILKLNYCPHQIKSVNVRSGFLIHFPATSEIVDILSGILSHNNAVICTYDFTSDIATLMECNVKVNMNNIFDAQLTSRCINPIQNTQVYSIINPANNLIGQIDEAEKAFNFMSQKKGHMFEFLTFLHKDDADPFLSMIDDDFYQYAAGDLVMTGLAVLYCYVHQTRDITEEVTKSKVDCFMGYINSTGNILMPSAVRQAAFIQKFNLASLQDFQKKLDTNPSSITIESDYDIKSYLTLYVKADMIYNIQDSLPPAEKKLFSIINAEKIRGFLEKLLEKKKDKISKLNPLDSGMGNAYEY